MQDINGEWRVSPVYDVPSSYLYGDKTMALSINGCTGSDFGIKHFVELGAQRAVPERSVRHTLADLAARVDDWLPRLADLPFDAGQLAKLRRVIQYRSRRLTG